MSTKAKNQKLNVSIESKNEIVETSEQIIENSFNTVNDEELSKGLDNLNIDLLTSKVDVNRSIWNEKAKSIKTTVTQSRNHLRNLQLSLSKSLLVSIHTKQSKEIQQSNAEKLFTFYSDYLVSFSNYSNISIEKEKDKRQLIDLAYQKMKLFKV